jgi:hypothetical protein
MCRMLSATMVLMWKTGTAQFWLAPTACSGQRHMECDKRGGGGGLTSAYPKHEIVASEGER